MKHVGLFLGLILMGSPLLLSQEAKPTPPIAFTEVERLRFDKLLLEIDKLDAQIQLLQERKDRLRTSDAQQLLDRTYKAHDLKPEDWSVNLQQMRFDKIDPLPTPPSH